MAISFSGNRLMTAPCGVEVEELGATIRRELSSLLEEFYSAGERQFFVGGAVGFDLLAAEVVMELRRAHHDVELTLVRPFEGQEIRYPTVDKLRYNEILESANDVVTIAEGYNVGAYHMRNGYLVSHCNTLIAYSNGEGRGTAATIKQAHQQGREVVNIYDMLGGATPPPRQLHLPF